MAALRDFIAKPRFFVRKPKYENSYYLCEKCKKHKIIIGAKWGCDYIVFTNVLAKKKGEVLDKNIHMWCEVDEPPRCLKAYQLIGPVDAG